jgi:regulator of protease activity HflC (stomatin/prohibitin superfamily)
MSKILTAIAAVIGIGGIVALTQLERIESGHVGIHVNLLGSDKGVDTVEVGPGRYWVTFNEELHSFPTFSQNAVWTASLEEGGPTDESLTFQSVEGMDIGADVGITYSVDPEQVSLLFQRYRLGIEEITDTYLRNMVRDALVNEASKMEVNAIYGTGKTGLMVAAEASVRAQVEDFGIHIERIYWIGSLRLPDKVIEAIDAEITANSEARQRQNEIAKTIAEAQKAREFAAGEADAILIRATAQATANDLLSESLTEEILRADMINRWDGVLPLMTGEGPVPMIDFGTLSR